MTTPNQATKAPPSHFTVAAKLAALKRFVHERGSKPASAEISVEGLNEATDPVVEMNRLEAVLRRMYPSEFSANPTIEEQLRKVNELLEQGA